MGEFKKSWDEGKQFFADSKFQHAEACFREALENIPQKCNLKDLIKVHEELADALFMQQKFAEAEEFYEKSITLANKNDLKERNGSCYTKLGATLGKQGRFIEAQDSLQEALKTIKSAHSESTGDYEIDEDVALIYDNLAELKYYLCEEKAEKRCRSIATNIQQTLKTIEDAEKVNTPTEAIIKRYVRPCDEEIRKKCKAENVYKMTANKRGFCLILNNRVFKDHTRDGSEVDEANLKNVFTQLNFDVTIVNDVSANDFEKKVESFVKDTKNKDYNAFVLVVMSHGNENNAILDSKYNPVLQHAILRKLYAAPLLTGKPRLAIIQACKGKDRNTATKEIPTSSTPCKSQLPKIDDDTTDILHTDQEDLTDPIPSNEKDTDHAELSTADCCIMHATFDGFVAHRDEKLGSPFIAALTEALFLYSHEKHMEEIFEKVKDIMKEKYSQFPQTPTIQLFFKSKKLYFFPGFDGDEDYQ